jgi:ribosomal protein S18 acetylase RimI-like enzyme
MSYKFYDMTYNDYKERVKTIDKEIFEEPYNNRPDYEYNLICAYYVKVGYKVAGFYILKSKEDDIVFLHTLAVDENFQGQGLGRKLVAHAILEGKKRDYKYIELRVKKDNRIALVLYRKMGFKVIAETRDKYNMQKSLRFASVTDKYSELI